MTTSEKSESGALVRAHSNKQFIGKRAEDIPPAWIDDMVNRLFHELNRQIIRAERASINAPEKRDHNNKVVDDVDDREKSARVLARLQTQLDRLTRLETERAALRATKESRTPAETRAAIHVTIMAALSAARTRDGVGEP